MTDAINLADRQHERRMVEASALLLDRIRAARR